jgi:MtrB/PioB family decaheme-associated outer membrane protein
MHRSQEEERTVRPTALVSVAAGLALACLALAVEAEETADPLTAFIGGTTVHGLVDAGGQPASVDGRRGKFEEYRDVPDNAVVNEVRIRGENDAHDYFAEFRAEDLIQDDQRYQLRMGRYGRYELEVEWDQIPHLLTTTGRTLFVEKADGELTLAEGLREILANDPAQLPRVLDAAHGIGLSTRQDTGRARFRYTPLADWDLRLAYAVERDRGRRPLATANFTGLTEPGDAPNPFLASIVELPSPVDLLTHTIESSIEHHAPGWFLRVGHFSSVFENRQEPLTWDNPFQLTDTLGGGSRGRLHLAPDNQAHTINVAGGATLPLRSRITGTFAYGWMLQDNAFQPATINAAVPVAPAPRSSPDGNIETLLANLLLTARPVDMVTITGRYRFYDLDNKTRSLVFDDYVVADAVRGVLRRSLPYAYSRHTAGGDVVLRPASLASLKVGYQWERWHREHREVRDSEEHRVGPALDLTPVRGLLVRAGYTHATRDPKDYDAFAGRASESPALYNPLLRKFDEAKRVRDQVSTLVSVTALPRIGFNGSFALSADDFTRSTFGLLDDDNLSYSLGLTATPLDRLTAYADYTREEHRFTQQVGLGPIGKADFRGRGHDTVDTYGAGVQAAVIPDKMDVDLNYSFSFGVGRLRASSATAGVDATDYPNVDTKLHQFSVVGSYKLTTRLALRLGYAFERFETNDFASQMMQPFVPSSDGPQDSARPPSLYLGARTPDGDSDAHVGTVAFRYEF